MSAVRLFPVAKIQPF